MTKKGRRGAIQPWHPLNSNPKFPYKIGTGFINQELDAEGNPQIYYQTRNFVLHCIGYIKNTIVWRWHDARQNDRYDGETLRKLRAERGVGRPTKSGAASGVVWKRYQEAQDAVSEELERITNE
jgi:hypothetical protein